MEAFKVTVEAVVGGIIFWRAASYGAIFAAGAGVCGAGVGVCAAEGGAIPVPGERRPPSPSPHPAGRKRQEKMTKRAVVGGGRPSPELKGRVRRGTPARLSLRASVACVPPPFPLPFPPPPPRPPCVSPCVSQPAWRWAWERPVHTSLPLPPALGLRATHSGRDTDPVHCTLSTLLQYSTLSTPPAVSITVYTAICLRDSCAPTCN